MRKLTVVPDAGAHPLTLRKRLDLSGYVNRLRIMDAWGPSDRELRRGQIQTLETVLKRREAVRADVIHRWARSTRSRLATGAGLSYERIRLSGVHVALTVLGATQ